MVRAWLAVALLVPSATVAQAVPDSATWSYGLELTSSPAALVRWETTQGDWVFGVGAGAGLGDERVRARLMPSIRIGRLLPGAVRLDAGLGFEWAWLDRAYNQRELEMQWEVTGGWTRPSWLKLEAGLRWTDYQVRRTEGLVRLSFARTRPAAPVVTPEVPDALLWFGVPQTVSSEGRVGVDLHRPVHSGSGFLIAAANPRGDPAPGTARAGGDNIDRLGQGAEAWFEHGRLETWLRWRSDLHTDPSIRDRIAPIADGLSFPVSVSFSGGATWRSPDVGDFGLAARHDPQALLWIPHLAAERTATVRAVEADAAHGDASVELRTLHLGSIAGRTLDPLTHTWMEARFGRATTVGGEHERLALSGRVVRRSRAVVEHAGPVFGRLAVGDDMVLEGGARGVAASWRGEIRVGYRSRPELLDYDALIARGWLWDGGQVGADGSSVVDATGSIERGSVRVNALGVWDDPTWMGDGTRRADGGYLDMEWNDTLASGRVEGRARVGLLRWGSPFGWWRERPGFDATGRVLLIEGPVRLSTDIAVRSALVSERSGMEEDGGAELAVALSGPLPALGPLRGMSGQARLEDVLDAGLPVRVGAPRRGRRLVLRVTLISGESR
ncbi:MAG: hypothetical protein WD995_09955 [Gemmatimonadota bacterium]